MTTQPAHQITESLVELGFTKLEADVYVFLLRQAPATGYKVAQGIGRTNANTYKAIESLEGKGAILVDRGASRVCRAIPPEELFGRLRRRFRETVERAQSALDRLPQVQNDNRIYQLPTRDAVIERAQAMLGRAQEIALLDVFPGLANDVRDAIRETAARGVRVTLKIYEPGDFGDALVVQRQRGHEVTEAIARDHLSVNIDGGEHLSALLRRGGEPYQAIWTSSPFLSYDFYSSLVHELILTDLREQINAGEPNDVLRQTLQRHHYLHPATNRNTVFQSFIRSLGESEADIAPPDEPPGDTNGPTKETS